MSVHQLGLLLSWDVECSPAWGGSRGSGPRHVPPWLPHSGPRCCHPLPPLRANLPQPCPILSCHQPQPPPCTVHSIVPPAPRPSQHLPHSPLPTSSSLPHLQELALSLPQPPTVPGPPARQPSCLWTRVQHKPRAMSSPAPPCPGHILAKGTGLHPHPCPHQRGIPVPALPGPGITLRLEAGEAPWYIHASVLSTPAALRPPCKTQSGDRCPQQWDTAPGKPLEGLGIPREQAACAYEAVSVELSSSVVRIRYSCASVSLRCCADCGSERVRRAGAGGSCLSSPGRDAGLSTGSSGSESSEVELPLLPEAARGAESWLVRGEPAQRSERLRLWLRGPGEVGERSWGKLASDLDLSTLAGQGRSCTGVRRRSRGEAGRGAGGAREGSCPSSAVPSGCWPKSLREAGESVP